MSHNTDLNERNLDDLIDEFENEWKAGREPNLREYLMRAKSEHKEAAMHELLEIDLMYRYRNYRDGKGQRPSFGLYLDQYPDFASIVERVFHPSTQCNPNDNADTSKLTPTRRSLDDPEFQSVLSEIRQSYDLLLVLGCGSFGQVYKARDRILGIEVAVKVGWRPAAQPAMDIVSEARTICKLNHPGIVRVYRADTTTGGTPYLVMEYLSGRSLRTRLLRRRRLETDEVLQLIVSLAEALEFAHQKGIVHRDLKPENILFDEHRRPRIVDFGLATPEVANSGCLAGSARYMSPEQFAGKPVDGRADIWALGVILYESLTGRQPFDGQNYADLRSSVENEAPPPIRQFSPSAPDGVIRVCMKCLTKRLDERYSSIRDLLADIKSLRNLKAVTALGEEASTTREMCTPENEHSKSDRQSVSRLSATNTSPDRLRRWPIPLIVSSASALIFTAIIIVIMTRSGEVVIEVNEPNAKLEIADAKNGDIRFQLEKYTKPISVKIDRGNHRLVVAKDGFEVHSEEFAIESNGRVQLHVKLVPLERSKLLAELGPLDLSGKSRVTDETLAQELELGNSQLRTEIIINNTGVTNLGLKHLVGLDRLERLHIGSLPIDDSALGSLKALTNLRYLGLYNTDVSGPGLEHLSGLENLIAIKLTSTKLTNIGLQHLSRIKSLEFLDVGSTRIDNDGLANLKKLARLSSLDIGYTSVTDDGLRHLSTLRELTQLSIRGNKITDEGLQHLRPLKNLRELAVTLTDNLTVNGIEELQKYLPGTVVVW